MSESPTYLSYEGPREFLVEVGDVACVPCPGDHVFLPTRRGDAEFVVVRVTWHVHIHDPNATEFSHKTQQSAVARVKRTGKVSK